MYFLGKWEGAYVLLHHPDKKTLQKFCPHEAKMGEYFFKNTLCSPPPPQLPKIKAKSQARTRPAALPAFPGGLGDLGRPPSAPTGRCPRGGGCFPWPAAGLGGDRAGPGGEVCPAPGGSPSPGHYSGATEMKPQSQQLLFSCRAPNYASTRSSRFPGAA